MDDFQLDQLLSHSHLDDQNEEVQSILVSKPFYHKHQFEEWMMQQVADEERF